MMMIFGSVCVFPTETVVLFSAFHKGMIQTGIYKLAPCPSLFTKCALSGCKITRAESDMGVY